MKDLKTVFPKSRMLAATASLAVIAAAPSSIAQSDDDMDVLDKIVVQGTKQGFTLQEAIVSAEVFTSKRLDNEALFELEDILLRTPNVSSVGSGLAEQNVSIRGIARRGTGEAGQGEAINTFVDGAPTSGTALGSGLQSTWDLQQVEILRGPQSTIQGRNSIGGAIVMQSKKPTYEWEAAGRLRVAEFDQRQYAGVVSGPIVEDQLAFRFSADYQERDSYVTNAFDPTDDQGADNLALRGKLLFEPEFIGDLSATLIVDYGNATNLNLTSVDAPAPDDPRRESFDPGNYASFLRSFRDIRETETYRVIGDVAYDLSHEFVLRVIGTYENSQSESNNTTLNEDGDPTINSTLIADEDITYSGEVRLEFDFDRLSGLVGGYFFDTEDDTDTQGTVAIDPFPFTSVIPGGSFFTATQNLLERTENRSVFGSVRFEASDRWTFDFGLRYDSEQFTITDKFKDLIVSPSNCVVAFQAPVIPLAIEQGLLEPGETMSSCERAVKRFLPKDDPVQSDDFGVWLPQGAVTYNFTDDFNVFVGARRGYRAAGTFVLVDAETGFPVGVGRFDPEFLLSYEGGWRSQLLNNTLTFNGTVFYSQYEDQQVSLPGPEDAAVSFSTITNAASSTIYGLELMGDYQPTDELNLFVTLGLLESEFDNFPLGGGSGSSAAPEINLAGNELPAAANVSYTVGTSYDHQSGMFGNVSYSYRGSAESDIFNLDPDELGDGLTERVDPHEDLRVSFGYRTDRYTIRAYGSNLLNDTSPSFISLADSNVLLPRAPDADVPFNERPSYGLRQPRSFGIMIDFKI
ncbi:MAG: TonB-dependent receptor [Pseudomonadota bacterium]